MIRKFSFAFDRAVLGTVFAGVSGQAMLIVSGVLIARNLGPHARGQLALIPAIAVATSFIAALGLPTAVAFAIAREGEAMIGAVHAVRRLIFCQVAAVYLVVACVLLAAFSDPSIRLASVLAVPPAAVALVLNMYGLAVLQGLHRFTAFNWLRMMPPLLYAIGAVFVIVAGLASVSAFLLVWAASYLIADLAIAIAVIPILRSARKADVDRRELVRYGVKAQIGTASPLETFQIDQLVVGAVAGPVSLGFYVIASAFMNLPRFISQSLGMVVFPRVAQRLNSGGARSVAREAIAATVLLAGGTVVLLELSMGRLIPFFFGDAYLQAIPAARILLVAALCFSLRRVLSDALRGADNPIAGTVAELVAWGAYAIVIVPMVLAWEATGAALAAAIASALGLAWIALAARSTGRRLSVDTLDAMREDAYSEPELSDATPGAWSATQAQT
jgi:O-antigen/teichoic acid export membrane protein